MLWKSFEEVLQLHILFKLNVNIFFSSILHFVPPPYPILPYPHAHICTHTFAHTPYSYSLEVFEALTALKCWTVFLSNPALFMTGQDKINKRSPLPFFHSFRYHHHDLPLLQYYHIPFSTSSFFHIHFPFSFLHFIFHFFLYFLHHREEKYADEYIRINHTLKQHHFIIYSMT